MSIHVFVLQHHSPITLGVFAAVLVLLAAWEAAAPRRAMQASRAVRWTNNVALAVLNMLMLRLLFPLAGVAWAAWVDERGAGLFNLLPVPDAVAVVASLLAFDLAVYLVHLAFHTAPVLWRMHRVHHADVDVDVSTALRFHPLQAGLSTLLKFAVIVALGTPPLAVLLFEAAFHALLLFNHANVRIAPRADRVLRWFVVTPDMHRVHHSVRASEANSNFGFALPWWDRLFGTYRARPLAGQAHMRMGIDGFRAPRHAWLDRLLLNPLLDERGAADAAKPGLAQTYQESLE